MKPRKITWGAIALVGAALWYGTPYLLVTYRCQELGEPHVFCFECHYYGLNGWEEHTPGPGECPMIRMYPVEWKE